MFASDMNRNCGLNPADAISKALKITKQDAERFPEIKANVFCSSNICALSKAYAIFDPDALYNKISSVETNLKRFRSEMTFIIKILAVDSTRNHKIHLGDKMRLMTLAKKYDISLQSERFDYLYFVFPDIYCNFLIKNANNLTFNSFSFKEYKNFDNLHLTPGHFSLLPTGKKYGGLVKALLHTNLLEYQVYAAFLQDISFYNCLAEFRAAFNTTIISQEKRVEFFEKLDIKEEDCISWSKTFDQKFPELAYVHKLFGQVA